MRLALALALALVLAAAGCPKHDATKKRLIIATTAEPDTLCALLSENGAAHEVIGLVARDLVVEDPTWHIRPDLAASVPSLENGGARIVDGKLVVTWTLRDDARWEDGAPVTAGDFVLGWRAQIDPTQAVVAGRDDALRVESMVPSVDGKSFVVTWKEPNPFFASPRVHRPLPSHLLGPRLVDGAKLRPLKDDPIGRKPLSNGPFRLVEWVPGQHLLFARNEHYTPRPALDEVLVKIVPSTTTILTMLQAGDVDAAFPSGGPSPVEAAAFAREHPGFAVEKAPGQIWAHIDFNLDDPALKDVRVRRAIAMAIPRKQIVDEVSHGMYAVADGYIPPQHWAHVDTAPIPYDPVQAKALLAAAGVKLPLALTLSAASGQRESEQMLELVRASLAAAGVDVSLDLRPFKVFFAEGAKKRKLPHLAFYSWTIDDTSMGGALWRSDRIPSEENGWKGQNLPAWKNDEVTAVLTEADRTLDEAARKKLVARAEILFADELPAVPMYFRPAVAVHTARVTGLAPTGTLTPLAWNASSWDVVSR